MRTYEGVTDAAVIMSAAFADVVAIVVVVITGSVPAPVAVATMMTSITSAATVIVNINVYM